MGAFNRNRQDASVNPAALALPSASSTTVNTASIDLDANTHTTDSIEVNVALPSQNTTELPDAESTTIALQDSLDNITFADIADEALVQTGAGGVGAVATSARIGIKSTVRRYIRCTATTSSSTGDQSGGSLTMTLVF